MDRRTKIILLSIGSVILLGVVFWFIIWPLLKPVLPQIKKPQPPAITEPNTPNPQTPTASSSDTGVQSPTFTYNPGDHPDAEQIAELSRRAGVFAERSESGSSQNNFENLAISAQGASSKLAESLRALQASMQKQHPQKGPLYLTIARRLIEIPENPDVIRGETFTVRVQLQVQVNDGGKNSVEYREATTVFSQTDGGWVISGYTVKPFNP